MITPLLNIQSNASKTYFRTHSHTFTWYNSMNNQAWRIDTTSQSRFWKTNLIIKFSLLKGVQFTKTKITLYSIHTKLNWCRKVLAGCLIRFDHCAFYNSLFTIQSSNKLLIWEISFRIYEKTYKQNTHSSNCGNESRNKIIMIDKQRMYK